MWRSVGSLMWQFRRAAPPDVALLPDGSLSLFGGQLAVRGKALAPPPASLKTPATAPVPFYHEVPGRVRPGELQPPPGGLPGTRFLVPLDPRDALALCFQSSAGGALAENHWPGFAGRSPYGLLRRTTFAIRVTSDSGAASSCIVPEPLEAGAILGLHARAREAETPRALVAPPCPFASGTRVAATDVDAIERSFRAISPRPPSERERRSRARHQRQEPPVRRSTVEPPDKPPPYTYITPPSGVADGTPPGLFLDEPVQRFSVHVWRSFPFLRCSELPVSFMDCRSSAQRQRDRESDSDRVRAQDMDEQTTPDDLNLAVGDKVFLWVPPADGTSALIPCARETRIADLLALPGGGRADDGEFELELRAVSGEHTIDVTAIARGQRVCTKLSLVRGTMKEAEELIMRVLGDFGLAYRRPLGWSFFDADSGDLVERYPNARAPRRLFAVELAPTQETIIDDPRNALDPFEFEDAFPLDEPPSYPPDCALSLMLLDACGSLGLLGRMPPSQQVPQSLRDLMDLRLSLESDAPVSSPDPPSALPSPHAPAPKRRLSPAPPKSEPLSASPVEKRPPGPRSDLPPSPAVLPDGSGDAEPSADLPSPEVVYPTVPRDERDETKRDEAERDSPREPTIEYILERRQISRRSRLWRNRPRYVDRCSRFYAGLRPQMFLCKWRDNVDHSYTWEPEWQLDAADPARVAFDRFFEKNAEPYNRGIFAFERHRKTLIVSALIAETEAIRAEQRR